MALRTNQQGDMGDLFGWLRESVTWHIAWFVISVGPCQRCLSCVYVKEYTSNSSHISSHLWVPFQKEGDRGEAPWKVETKVREKSPKLLVGARITF